MLVKRIAKKHLSNNDKKINFVPGLDGFWWTGEFWLILCWQMSSIFFIIKICTHIFWNTMQHADEFILQCLHYCNHLKMFASRVLNDKVGY